MAGRNTLRLDTRGFEELITKLEGLGGDVKAAVTDALEQAAETVEEDTKEAVQASNLPAHGKYSKGDTMDSIVTSARTDWHGTLAEIKLGFDYSKPGAGGFLITGTPRMKPDKELNKIYKKKKYMSDLQKDMQEVVNDAIIERMEGS